MSETITAVMSRWAAGLEFEQLGERAIHEARRYLLDSLGCALGGYRQEDVEDRPGGARRGRRGGAGHGDRQWPQARRCVRRLGQRPDGASDGLQRYLLAAGSIAPVRHHPRGDRLR